MDSPRAKYTRITEHSMVNGSESAGREEEIVGHDSVIVRRFCLGGLGVRGRCRYYIRRGWDHDWLAGKNRRPAILVRGSGSTVSILPRCMRIG